MEIPVPIRRYFLSGYKPSILWHNRWELCQWLQQESGMSILKLYFTIARLPCWPERPLIGLCIPAEILHTVRPLIQDTWNSQILMFFVPPWSCLCPIYWSHVLSGEWRLSWSSAQLHTYYSFSIVPAVCSARFSYIAPHCCGFELWLNPHNCFDNN